jgi:membrane protein DedA with SNARE-associated domain
MHPVLSALLASGSPPALPGFLNSLASPLQHYGLWAILAFVLLEDFGVPVPGETVLIAGAIYAGSGRLNVVEVGLVGFAAAILGDNIGYGIGRLGGRELIERWGKYIFLTPERLEKTEAFFDRHGGKIIVVARFIEGLRQANGIIAGIARMHWLRFGLFNALGAALWVGTWVSVGYFAGQHIDTIYTDITRYSLYAAIAAVVVIIAWVLLRLRRHRATARDGGTDPGTDTDAHATHAGTGAHADADTHADTEARATHAHAGTEAGADASGDGDGAAAETADKA